MNVCSRITTNGRSRDDHVFSLREMRSKQTKELHILYPVPRDDSMSEGSLCWGVSRTSRQCFFKSRRQRCFFESPGVLVSSLFLSLLCYV